MSFYLDNNDKKRGCGCWLPFCSPGGTCAERHMNSHSGASYSLNRFPSWDYKPSPRRYLQRTRKTHHEIPIQSKQIRINRPPRRTRWRFSQVHTQIGELNLFKDMGFVMQDVHGYDVEVRGVPVYSTQKKVLESSAVCSKSQRAPGDGIAGHCTCDSVPLVRRFQLAKQVTEMHPLSVGPGSEIHATQLSDVIRGNAFLELIKFLHRRDLP